MIEVAIVVAVFVTVIALPVGWQLKTKAARVQARAEQEKQERLFEERLARRRALIEQIERETPDWVIERRRRAAERAKGRRPSDQ